MKQPQSQTAQPTVLVCTLGGKPQIGTFALDALLAQSVPSAGQPAVQQVCAVHLDESDPRIARSLACLGQHLHNDYTPAIAYERVPVREWLPQADAGEGGLVAGRAIAGVEDRATSEAIRMTLHRLFNRLKADGYAIKLCITGGPRLLGMQALAMASLSFRDYDHCWHLFTPPELRAAAGEGALMHVPAHALNPLRLIPVPLLPIGAFFPALQLATPEQLLAQQSALLSQADRARCAQVSDRLTPRQREVLRLLARGQDNAAAAAALHLSPNTIASHKQVILALCREVWALDFAARLPATFLRDTFGRLPTL